MIFVVLFLHLFLFASCLYSIEPEGYAYIKIENFSKFAKSEAKRGNELISERMLIRGMPWKFVVKNMYSEDEWYQWEFNLITELHCGEEPGVDWSSNVSMTFRVLALTEDKQNLEIEILPQTIRFNREHTHTKKFWKLVKTKKLLDPENGWYDPKQDFIIVEAYIKADPPNGIAKMPVPIGKRLGDLFESGKAADVKFLVHEKGQKELISAHKFVLVAASDVFEKIFRSYKEQNRETEPIELDEDVTSEAFKMLLKYIYTDDIRGLNEDQLDEFLYAATKYKVEIHIKPKQPKRVAYHQIALNLPFPVTKQIDLMEPEGFVYLKMGHFSDYLYEKVASSEPVLIRGIPCRLVATCKEYTETYHYENDAIRVTYHYVKDGKIYDNDNENDDKIYDNAPKHLVAGLQCDGEPGENWSSNLSVDFRVLSLRNDKQDIEITTPVPPPSKNAKNNGHQIFSRMVCIEDFYYKTKEALYGMYYNFIIVEAHIRTELPKGIVYQPNESKMPVPVGKRLGDLFESGKEADVKFLVGPEEGEKELISAHSTLLTAASDVFETMFRFHEGQNKEFFEEKDVTIEAFRMLLKYIYTNDLSGLNKDNLYDVLYAARKYNVENVFHSCVEFMPLEADNVLFVLALAQFFEEQNLLNRCWAFIDQNVYEVIEKEEFLEIDHEMLGELLGRNQLMMYRKPWKGGEMALWRAALRWADDQCRRKELEISGENRRQMLGSALYKIRIPLMKKQEFRREIVPTKVLSEEEVTSVDNHHSCRKLATCDKDPLKFPNHTRS